MEILLKIIFFFVGASVGSFLNVLIYRLPLGLSVVSPRSSCPGCKTPIAWYLNIPVLSYLLLRGKCLSCKNSIPLFYFLTEVLMGLISLNFMPDLSAPQTLFTYYISMSVLAVFLAQFIIDLKHKLLPDVLNLYLAFVLFIASVIEFPILHWVLGGAIGFGFPYLITWLFYKYSGKIGLGGGDIKLYGALGIYLGPVGVMTNIFMSCFLGSVVTLALIGLKIVKRDDYIPFGPYILVISTFQIFFPDSFTQVLKFLGLSLY